MKNRKMMALVLMMSLIVVSGLAACATSTSSDQGTAGGNSGGAAVAPGDVAGFEEFSIGDDIELGPLNVAAVYFQPVDMQPVGSSLPASEADMHLEADISALANTDLGYGTGNFVPYLTVRYEIESKDGKIIEGNFMPMNASDGPHYGANVKLGKAGTYKVRFIIESPEAQGFLLHVDQKTGVTGRFWNEPLVAEWNFDYVPRVW